MGRGMEPLVKSVQGTLGMVVYPFNHSMEDHCKFEAGLANKSRF